MKSTMLFLACSCAIMAISCQKNKQNPPAEPPVTSHETKRVYLKLTGDILTTETPLPNGRQAGDGVLNNAKNYGTKTLYSVAVREVTGYHPLYTGLFSHPDSVYINVPTSGQYNVSVGIYKKGTGGGLWYTLENGLPYFDSPMWSSVKNRMDTVTGWPYLLDSVAGTRTVNPLDTANSLWPVYYPEVEYFQGDTNFVGSTNPAPISINIKRRSFGIQFSATNFTSGKITAEYSWNNWDYTTTPRLTAMSVTPADINSQYHIIAADEFRTSDSTWGIYVRINYIKTNGTAVHLGDKLLHFKRNVLTKIHLTLASDGRAALQPQITETDWSGNEIINF